MTTKPRKLQEIFNAVIEAGHYPRAKYATKENRKPTSDFMCASIDYSLDSGIITKEESHKAKHAIRIYINNLIKIRDCYSEGMQLPSLWYALYCARLVENKTYYADIGQPILLNIYKNWAKRPYPKSK